MINTKYVFCQEECPKTPELAVFMYLVDKNKKNDAVESTGTGTGTGTGTVQEGGTPSLGSIAKSSTEIYDVNAKKLLIEQQLTAVKLARKKRYSLATSIRAIFIAEGRKRGLLIPTKIHRQSLCKWALTGSEVHLMKNELTQKAFFKGVQTCGSVWCCPVCANRIQEVRRQEIAKAMKHFTSQGKQAVMVTFTFPHTKADSLKDLLIKQKKAFEDLRSGDDWTKFKKIVGFEGLIRSLEVTRGGNGWHPHTHELWFCSAKQNEKAFIKSLVLRWYKFCLLNGLVGKSREDKKSFLAHSVDVKFNCTGSDYLAKMDDKANWGIDREIAKASSKMGKSKGMHPFELAFKGYQALWIEYSEAIKGKAQLYWSPGLKKTCGVDILKDEEIAKEEEKEPEYIFNLSKSEWAEVLKKELRSDVLDWVEENNNKETVMQKIIDS